MPEQPVAEVDEHLTIAFLFCKRMKDENEIYRGAALVTDSRCKPLEFRCTSPVRPNAVQRMLYGNTLIPHIGVELMGLPLLRAVQKKPDMVLARDGFFLEARPKIDFPIFYLRRQGESITVEDSQKARHVSAEETVLNAPSDRFNPLVVLPHWNFKADREFVVKLRAAFGYADLLEPFDRIDLALDEVHRQETSKER